MGYPHNVKKQAEIVRRLRQGESTFDVAWDFGLTMRRIQKLYRNYTGQSLSALRMVQSGVLEQNRKENKKCVRELSYEYGYEPFDEPGWEQFGMIVLE